jgi:hypothetical protein
VFRDVARGFDTVLIDEAAQANEIATLIPFLHGAKRCVLVGDPRQLPSTVLSAAAKRSNFQRSLFERFVGLGAEPILLQVSISHVSHTASLIARTRTRRDYYLCSYKTFRLPDCPYEADTFLFTIRCSTACTRKSEPGRPVSSTTAGLRTARA